MPIVVVLVLVVVGSVAFHILSPWWWTPIASNWDYIDTTLVMTFWITGAVFTAVILFMAYCVFRFRHTEGRKAAFEPENRRLELWLTAITGVGVAAMLLPGLIVWDQFVTVPEGADEVEVFAQQWSWDYRLPGADGRLGTSGADWVSADNPLGINPHDRFGKDDIIVEGGELYLPLDRPVRVWLRSVDVLHNFYVPEFRAKMDMVPGMVTYFWITPTRTGEFEVLCAEYCGTAHAYMRGSVIVVGAEDYQEWLANQITFEEYAKAARDGRSVRVAGR
ncbi:cytochrome c oxidase subunit II [Aliiroseovarius sp.]|uniref:cytochrome c oxidase subunit II n=1 Tax=Aliiroseovarius sp. TaxID=1872442 RepID=UPI003BA8885E